jgi:tRNA uridine 5-carbamoylmethylation protein Kti12
MTSNKTVKSEKSYYVPNVRSDLVILHKRLPTLQLMSECLKNKTVKCEKFNYVSNVRSDLVILHKRLHTLQLMSECLKNN